MKKVETPTRLKPGGVRAITVRSPASEEVETPTRLKAGGVRAITVRSPASEEVETSNAAVKRVVPQFLHHPKAECTEDTTRF